MDERKRSKRTVVYYAFRIAAFVFLLYGIDHTPLRPERVVAYLHLGMFGAFIFALIGVCVLWWWGGVLLGLLLVTFGLLAMPFIKK